MDEAAEGVASLARVVLALARGRGRGGGEEQDETEDERAEMHGGWSDSSGVREVNAKDLFLYPCLHHEPLQGTPSATSQHRIVLECYYVMSFKGSEDSLSSAVVHYIIGKQVRR